jgi:hypothetical protein
MIGGAPIVSTVRPSLHLNVQFRQACWRICLHLSALCDKNESSHPGAISWESVPGIHQQTEETIGVETIGVE